MRQRIRDDGVRTVCVSTGWDGGNEEVPAGEVFGEERVRGEVGGAYRVVVWHEAGAKVAGVEVEVEGGGGGVEASVVREERERGASVVWVPVDKGARTTIRVRYAGGEEE